MKKQSLKFKVFVLFSFPLIAFIYISFLFMNYKYDKILNASAFELSVEISYNLSTLLHNLQIERGLSSGYIAREENTLYTQGLVKHYEKTNKAYKEVLKSFKSQLQNKKLQELISFKTKPLFDEIHNELQNLEQIRKDVLNLNIDFKEEVQYYTQVNKKLIFLIKVLNSLFKGMQEDSIAIIKLQELKEYAGLERAYTYNQILSNYNDAIALLKLKKFKMKQDELLEDFLANASENSILLYNKYYKTKIINILKFCRDGVYKQVMKTDEADKCFNASTEYINMFSQIYTQMLNTHYTNTKQIHNKLLDSLYITIVFLLIAAVAIALLAYILKSLISKEEETKQELIIASYAFDAQEAITITDINGTIIRVNNAFTKITGYTAKEVIGKNPSILKSTMHTKKFFVDMWDELLRTGSWQGEIYNQRKNTEVYPEMLSITAIKDDDNITTHYIGQFLDISDIKKAKELAQYQADHDFLTALLNRKSLIERLNEEFVKAKRHKLVHAFLFIDLDNFKSINDNYGHDTGDKVIIETSKRIKNILRQEDVAARISGDEFGVMLVNLGDTESQAAIGVKQVCTKILSEINKEFYINNQKLYITLSIGIKIFPDYEKNVQDIIIHADKAMYEAKKQGKNNFMFFNDKIEDKLKRFVVLEKEIKQSIVDEDFVFFYQPKVSTSNGKVVGAELLVRWQHPSKGLLYPDSFINIAEEIGVTDKFSILALKNACNFINENGEKFDGTLAINISSKELLHPNFEQNIISIITTSGVNPQKIELEITESMIIEKFDLAIQKMNKLQEFGVRFSIDDFGTGYSSITYLQKLPVDTLKIDRWFLQNIEEDSNKELIKMIANIAKTFKMQIIAEGIETKEQLEFIKNINIESYQGFYFSKAIEEQDFKKLL